MSDETYLTLTVLRPVQVTHPPGKVPLFHCGRNLRITASDDGAVALTEFLGCYDAWAFLSTGAFGMVEVPSYLLTDVEVERKYDGDRWSFVLRNRRTGASLDPIGQGGMRDGRAVNDLSVCIEEARGDPAKVILSVTATGSAVDWFSENSDSVRTYRDKSYIEGDDGSPPT